MPLTSTARASSFGTPREKGARIYLASCYCDVRPVGSGPERGDPAVLRLHRPPHRGRQAYRHIVVLAFTMHDAHGASLLVAILLEVPEFGYEVACQLEVRAYRDALIAEG